MNLKKSQDRIKELMTKFVTAIKVARAGDRTDINCESENVLIPLLSEIYGHTELKNLNVSEGSNFPAIDLGDEKTRTAYQITSTPTSEKVKDTLKKFVNHNLYERYDRLVIYILTEKQNIYQGWQFDKIIQRKFSFDKESDILDYRDLLKEISGFSLEQSRKVEKILEEHFGEREYICPLDWLEKVNNLWGEVSATIKINREKLLKDLQDFASQGNGVIIGSSGVGKTYVLKELRHSLKSNGIPHLLLPIDQLGDGTDKILRQELSYEGDLITKLKSVPVSDKKAILLFDAFDAARDERTRKRFLNLIRRAIYELSETWNVVVTVRTYDAKKSQELLDLFGSSDDTNYIEEILCRHFTIPSLNVGEIQQAFDQIPHLESVYNNGSKDFKRLLTNPFNLWLLEKILKTSENIPDFSQIRSEVQLLNLFWRRRIAPVSDELHRLPILTQIARQMVNEHSLTVRLDNLFENLDLDKPARETAWDNLFSNEILIRVSSTGQRIAFSHNILFDYAISVLLIEDEPKQIEHFVLEDPSRPIFLRPSFTYFFTRLWYNAPDTFWNAFWFIFPSNQSVHMRLFARLIPTSVIANETREIEELTPLLDKLKKGEEIANDAVAWLLQSLRALEIERDFLWSVFFDRVSVYLHRELAWDLASLTSKMLERATNAEDSAVIGACGQVGRRLLSWIWQEKETRENDWYNQLGGRWAIPLVAKSYGTNVDESRALLSKVLEMTQVDNFPIDFLTWLTEHVDKIWAHDPEFVALIYRAVFTHNETGDEKTHMGGIILPMTSTRRQDYSMCQYRLIEHFPNFLQASPLPATQPVIQSLNFFIINTKIFSSRQEGVLVETFNFRGKLARFVQDDSDMWDQREMRNEPIEMADALFEFIEGLAKSKESFWLLDSLLDVFGDHAEVAFFWKRLLKTATQFPDVFAPRLFELCIAKPIQIGNDVSYDFCTFLEAAAPQFTHEQRLQIEESILGLAGEGEQNRESHVQRRDQLLGQIPQHLLLTDAAKQIREEMERDDDVPENRPPARPHIWAGPYTDEKWLQGQGVDTATSKNQALLRFFDPLNNFSSDWLNGKPTKEATELILPTLAGGYAAIKRNAETDKEVLDSLWYKLATCTAILARVADNRESHLFAFCRQLLLDAATHELPKPNPDLDNQFIPSMYSPFPRHKAAEGLLWLAVYRSDEKLLDTIESLANDPVPSVRMTTAMGLHMVYFTNPDRFWCIVDDRATNESNQVVQEFIYRALARVVASEQANEEKTIHVMEKLLRPTLLSTDTFEPPDSCIDLLIWLAIDRENLWALKTLEDTLIKDTVRFANPLRHAVNRAMKDYVVPKNLETPDGHEKAKRAIEWLSMVIAVVSERIKELSSAFKADSNEEVKKQLHDTYGVIDQVVMSLNEDIPPELRCRFYIEVKPLMKAIIDFAQDPNNGVMFAPTAYRFMQLLTSFLSCNPKEVLHLAEGVARSSERFGYNLDSLAIEEVVTFVEIVLADHRSEVRDREGLKDLLNLLDIFVRAGWSDALRLVWRLDEIFR